MPPPLFIASRVVAIVPMQKTAVMIMKAASALFLTQRSRAESREEPQSRKFPLLSLMQPPLVSSFLPR